MSLKEKLSKMEYHVTQEAGTEPPFSGKYHDEKSEGIYQCVCCDDNLFSSKVIVITGSFKGIARSQLKEELIRSGARVSGSVSNRTDYLIAGEKPGSKLKKAVDLGIEVIEEDKVLEILANQ